MGCELLLDPEEKLNSILGTSGGSWCPFLLSTRWDLQGCVRGRCKWIFAMARFGHRGWVCHWCTPQKWNICSGANTAPPQNALGCLRGSQVLCVRAVIPKLAKQSDVGCCREALKGPSVSQPAMGRFPLLANARLVLEKLSVITPSQL